MTLSIRIMNENISILPTMVFFIGVLGPNRSRGVTISVGTSHYPATRAVFASFVCDSLLSGNHRMLNIHRCVLCDALALLIRTPCFRSDSDVDVVLGRGRAHAAQHSWTPERWIEAKSFLNRQCRAHTHIQTHTTPHNTHTHSVRWPFVMRNE